MGLMEAWMNVALLIVLLGLCVRSLLSRPAIPFRGQFWSSPAVQYTR